MRESIWEQRVALAIDVDIRLWQRGQPGFKSQLLELIALADKWQMKELARIYPVHVEAYRRWQRRTI